MKLKNIVTLFAIVGAGVLCICGCASMGHHNSIEAKAKLSKEEAQQIALSKVPGGTIKEGELEMENGVLQWSFDVAMQGSQNITEVNINAVTGKVIGVDVETPGAEAKEAKAEALAKKGKPEKDDDEKDEKK